MDDLASIMMPAYNAELYIGEAIDSVLAQSYPDWELVVVDDGSTDGTAQIVSRYQDSRIKLVSQENSGEAAARNTALRHISGRFVAFLDADDQYLPNHLELTLGALYEHPGWDGVYSDGIHIDSQGNELPTLSSRRRGPFEGWLFEELVRASDVFGPPICVVVCRDKIIERDLWYDTRIIIGPDWEFFTRFSEQATFSYLNRITCKYRVHQTNISVRAKQQVRLQSLALCRMKAIQNENFTKCSVDTQSYVFYDLLINLMTGDPQEQDKCMHWHQFETLPADVQARLLRLAAGREIAFGGNVNMARKWLERSLQYEPLDYRSKLIDLLVKFNPGLAGKILRRRYTQPADSVIFSPFADIS